MKLLRVNAQSVTDHVPFIRGYSHVVFHSIRGIHQDTVKNGAPADTMAEPQRTERTVLFGPRLLYFPNVRAFHAGHRSVVYCHGIPPDGGDGPITLVSSYVTEEPRSLLRPQSPGGTATSAHPMVRHYLTTPHLQQSLTSNIYRVNSQQV